MRPKRCHGGLAEKITQGLSVFSENKPGHVENLPPLGTKDPYEVMYTVNTFRIFASYHSLGLELLLIYRDDG